MGIEGSPFFNIYYSDIKGVFQRYKDNVFKRKTNMYSVANGLLELLHVKSRV